MTQWLDDLYYSEKQSRKWKSVPGKRAREGLTGKATIKARLEKEKGVNVSLVDIRGEAPGKDQGKWPPSLPVPHHTARLPLRRAGGG